VVGSTAFPDHHNYSAQDIQLLGKQASECDVTCDAILCSGKDLAKIDSMRIGQYELWSLDVELTIRTGTAILEEYLERIVASVAMDGTEHDKDDGISE
jgi:tetraacyldisaccharide-1-P 4'-kinase